MPPMRDDLNAALDAAAKTDPTQNYEETEQEVLIDEPAVEDSSDAEPGAGETDQTEAEPGGEEEGEGEGEKPAEPEPEQKLKGENDSIKAPVDWGPKDRESWSKIPRHLQEKVMTREKELNTLLQSTVEARKTHEDFGKLTQKYGAALSGVAGNTPLETVDNLFSTVANLRMGSPIQKAQIIADMISDFGVDINTLDSALVGAAPPQEQQDASRFEQMLSERMAPFEKMMGQQNAYVQQQRAQVQESANQEVSSFAQKAEFLNDVRMDMADLVDMASKRGYNMPLEEAYNKACALNPEVQGIINERKKRTDLMGGNANIANKRLAASSVNGQRIGNGSGGGDMSIHDMLSSAWDNQGKV